MNLPIEETKLYKERNLVIDEFTKTINRYSLENDSYTPDYILGEYLYDCLMAFNLGVCKRIMWYNPGGHRENSKMNFHYFDLDKAPESDILLQMAIDQGYVPHGCLLNGKLVMSEINLGNDPCDGCNGPREKCHGRPKGRINE